MTNVSIVKKGQVQKWRKIIVKNLAHVFSNTNFSIMKNILLIYKWLKMYIIEMEVEKR